MSKSSLLCAMLGMVASSVAMPAAADDYGVEGDPLEYGAEDSAADESHVEDYGAGAKRAATYRAIGYRADVYRAEDRRGERRFEEERVRDHGLEQARTAASRDEGARAKERFGAGHVQLRGGATYRRLYDIPVYGEELGVALGAWDGDDGDYCSLDFIVGQTDYGLSVQGASLGYRADWRISRVRVGFNVGMGVMRIERVTDDVTIDGMGLVLSALAGYDVLRTRSGVLSIDGAFNLDPWIGNDPVAVWGPTLGLSYRL